MEFAYNEYSQAVTGSGGAPLLIPVAQNTKSLSAIIDRLDGLILSGGVDVNPKFYGEEPVTGLGEIDEDRDRTEIQLTKMAYKRGLPIFAICRGIQMLNISLGGTLYQDIANQVKESIYHTQNAAKSVTTHTVRVESQTALYQIFKRKTAWVNGKHHQAVKDVARGFRVGAKAPDGVIEAIENPSKKFVLGVQWHPEGTWRSDTYSKKLFRAFINAAKKKS
jgi:putative glutamine amidotransferase